MCVKDPATILLVMFVLAGECQVHGGEHFFPGLLQGVETSAQKRMTYKKGDHLFNNIAKALMDIIRDVFWMTHLKNFCKAYPVENEFIIVDNLANNRDVTDQFPAMVNNFKGYKTDKLLTADRDSLSVYGQKHVGPDANALNWSRTIEELRKIVFNLINKTIEMAWSLPKKKNNKEKETEEEKRREQEIVDQYRNRLNGLLQNLRNRINLIINGGQYVDQQARADFVKNKQNSNRIALMQAVEEHIQETLRSLPDRVKQWAVEAANFYRKKLK